MHPILFDLSQWRPLGFSLDHFAARAAAFLLSAALTYAAGLLWSARRRRLRGQARWRRWIDGLQLAAGAAMAAGGVGLMWAIGKGHSYGLMLALGLLAGTGLLRRLARRGDLPAGPVSSVALVALVAGVLGARLAYVIEHWSELAGGSATGFLLDAASIASGGLVFDGGLVLALLGVIVYLRRRRLPIRRFLDILAIGAMVGLAFGRIGCFLNGCCYGDPCRDHWPTAVRYPYAASPLIYPHPADRPYPPGTAISAVYRQQAESGGWGRVPPELLTVSAGGAARLKAPEQLRTPAEIDAARHARSGPVHPAQLYAAAADVALAALLWLAWRRGRRPGAVFALMLVLYAVMRFGLEFIRNDNPGMLLTPAQLKCLVLLGVGAAMLVGLRLGEKTANGR